MDFLNYWDTRIDANERFFNNCPHIANFAFSECQELWDHMEGENKAILARHNEIVTAHAELLINHNALVEAVVWERECSSQDMCGAVADYAHHLYTRHGQDYLDEIQADFDGIIDAARAEVDRLIANGSAADCKGEG